MLEEYIRTAAFYSELEKIGFWKKINPAIKNLRKAKSSEDIMSKAVVERIKKHESEALGRTMSKEIEARARRAKGYTPKIPSAKTPVVEKTTKRYGKKALGYGATAVGAGGAGIYGGYKYNKRKRARVY